MAQVAGTVVSTDAAATAAGASTTSASSAGAAAPPASLESVADAVPPRIILVPGNIADWHEAGPVASLVPSAIVPPVTPPASDGTATAGEGCCSSARAAAAATAHPFVDAVLPPLPPVLHVVCPIPCVLPGEAYPTMPEGAAHPWFQIFKKRERLPAAPPEGFHKVAGHDIFNEGYALRPTQDDTRTGSSSRPLPAGWPGVFGSTTRRRLRAAAAAGYDTDDDE